MVPQTIGCYQAVPYMVGAFPLQAPWSLIDGTDACMVGAFPLWAPWLLVIVLTERHLVLLYSKQARRVAHRDTISQVLDERQQGE